MDFSSEQEEHKVIHDFLDKFGEIIKKGKANPSSFDAAATLQLVEGVKPTLVCDYDAYSG